MSEKRYLLERGGEIVIYRDAAGRVDRVVRLVHERQRTSVEVQHNFVGLSDAAILGELNRKPDL